MKKIIAITIVVAGFALLLGIRITDSTEASNNFQQTSVWNSFVERQVFFEADTDAGFFEMELEESVGGDGETERILEVCFPHFDGFICEDVDVDEEDMDIDF